MKAKGNKYILGEQFTAADVVMGHCLNWSKAYGLCGNEERMYFSLFMPDSVDDRSFPNLVLRQLVNIGLAFFAPMNLQSVGTYIVT